MSLQDHETERERKKREQKQCRESSKGINPPGRIRLETDIFMITVAINIP